MGVVPQKPRGIGFYAIAGSRPSCPRKSDSYWDGDEWACEYCQAANDADRERCHECGAPRPANNQPRFDEGPSLVYAPFIPIDVGNMSKKEAEEALERARVMIKGPDKPV
jgi:hypothetical protein